MSNNQELSDDFLNSVKTIDNIPCFVKINDSKFVVIALHEHLGLVQNFTDLVSKFVQNYASIIIPDLFCNIEVEDIDEQDQFACLSQLNIAEVYLILKKCIAYAKDKDKIIILMGFSVGSAIGIKLIEKLKTISMGIFFYGYPLAKGLQPQNIHCPVVIFHAEKDKVKHLSDNNHLKQLLTLYHKQPNLQIENIDSSHGFMNHQHPNFDEKSFKYCRKLFHQYLIELEKNNGKLPEKDQAGDKTKKDDQGGCKIY